MKPRNRRKWLTFKRTPRQHKWFTVNLWEAWWSYHQRQNIPKLVIFGQACWLSLLLVFSCLLVRSYRISVSSPGLLEFLLILELLSNVVLVFMILMFGNLLIAEVVNPQRYHQVVQSRYLFPVISILIATGFLTEMRLLGGVWWQVLQGNNVDLSLWLYKWRGVNGMWNVVSCIATVIAIWKLGITNDQMPE